MKKTLRLTSLVLAILTLAFTFAGCGGTEKTSSEATTQASTNNQESAGETSSEPEKVLEPVSLKYYTNSSVTKDQFDQAITTWNSENPSIGVELVVLVGADSIDKMRTAIAGGEKIDLVEMEQMSFRDKAAKMYYKLNDFISKEGINYFDEYGLYGKSTMVGEEIYGLPKDLAPSAIWVNKDMLDKAGVALPNDMEWTFDDYFEMIKKLTVKGVDGKVECYGGMHWQQTWNGSYAGIMEYAAFSGWDIVNEDGKPNVYDARLRKIIELFYNATLVDGSMPTDADTKANNYVSLVDFGKGKFATFMGASNSALFFDAFVDGGNIPKDWDDRDAIEILSPPRWDKNSTPNMTNPIVGSMAIAKTTQNPEEAYKFLRWYTTNAVVLGAKVAHRIPVWLKADENVLTQSWRFYKNKDGAVVEGKERDKIYLKAMDKTRVPVFYENRVKYEYSSMMLEELKKEISLIFTGEKDIDAGLRDAQKACEKIWEKEK